MTVVYYDKQTMQVEFVYNGCDRKDTPQDMIRAEVADGLKLTRDYKYAGSGVFTQSTNPIQPPPPKDLKAEYAAAIDKTDYIAKLLNLKD